MRSRTSVVLAVVSATLCATLSAVTAAPAQAAPMQAGQAVQPAHSKPQPVLCGSSSTLPKRTGHGTWTCTFDDEFSGSTLDTSKWAVQVTATSGYHSGIECYKASGNNVAEGNGVLTLTAQQEPAPFTCASPFGNYTTQYTGGMVSTSGLFSQTYGRFEVRAKLPAATVAGLHEAFWLWPVDPAKYGAWPASGEVDFAEFYSLYPRRPMPYVHYNSASADANVTSSSCFNADLTQWHTYVLEWTSSTMTVLYDNTVCISDSWNPAAPLVKPQPFDSPFILALTQALGSGTNAFDPSTTPLPASTQVDYVRIYK